jgi:hypothetical protein
MDASFHPSHRELETKGDTTSHARTGQTRRVGGCTNAPSTAATLPAMQHQRLATLTMMPPLAGGAETMLVTTHQLLKNPPPWAHRLRRHQWRHNVEQLILTAIKMPPRGGHRANNSDGRHEPSALHSHTPTVARISSSTHVQMRTHVSTVNIATTDL